MPRRAAAVSREGMAASQAGFARWPSWRSESSLVGASARSSQPLPKLDAGGLRGYRPPKRLTLLKERENHGRHGKEHFGERDSRLAQDQAGAREGDQRGDPFQYHRGSGWYLDLGFDQGFRLGSNRGARDAEDDDRGQRPGLHQNPAKAAQCSDGRDAGQAQVQANGHGLGDETRQAVVLGSSAHALGVAPQRP